jgi:hypothetical protein
VLGEDRRDELAQRAQQRSWIRASARMRSRSPPSDSHAKPLACAVGNPDGAAWMRRSSSILRCS